MFSLFCSSSLTLAKLQLVPTVSVCMHIIRVVCSGCLSVTAARVSAATGKTLNAHTTHTLARHSTCSRTSRLCVTQKPDNSARHQEQACTLAVYCIRTRVSVHSFLCAAMPMSRLRHYRTSSGPHAKWTSAAASFAWRPDCSASRSPYNFTDHVTTGVCIQFKLHVLLS